MSSLAAAAPGRSGATRRPPAPSRRPVQLTRRGRFALVLALALVALLALVSLSLGSVNATTDAPQDVVTHVTVQPGETLWQIARRVAPDADPRDTVARIMTLNGLGDARVLAGQDLLVPAAR